MLHNRFQRTIPNCPKRHGVWFSTYGIGPKLDLQISEWMFDRWRIICKASQNVGDTMKEAVIKEGLLKFKFANLNL